MSPEPVRSAIQGSIEPGPSVGTGPPKSLLKPTVAHWRTDRGAVDPVDDVGTFAPFPRTCETSSLPRAEVADILRTRVRVDAGGGRAEFESAPLSGRCARFISAKLGAHTSR